MGEGGAAPHTLRSAAMRNGEDYKKSLNDGRKVWVMGEGRVDDMTTHPATRGMVDEYAAWYDRQLDPAWRDLLISPPGATEAGTPLVYILPMNTDDLVRMGKAYARLAFITAVQPPLCSTSRLPGTTSAAPCGTCRVRRGRS